MSIEQLNNAFKCDLQKSSLKFILVALADYSNEEGEAYPSIQTLTNKTALHYKTINAGLIELEQLGYIERTGRKVGRTNAVTVWRVTICKHPQKVPTFISTPKKVGAKHPQKVRIEPSLSLTTRESNSKIDFDEFYAKYPVKTTKRDCEKKWNKLSLKKQQSAIDGIANFILHKEKKYISSPTRYINGELWNDEARSKDDNGNAKLFNSNGRSGKSRSTVQDRIKRLG
tara:strand:- start:652 stop:1335 length:684 start_codon:yes stop_codon:yes gene_type:complete